MRIRIVVLLAEEHDVGAREIGKHRLEIRERLLPRVVDALRYVRPANLLVSRWDRRRLKKGQEERRDEDGDHGSIVCPDHARVNAGIPAARYVSGALAAP